MTKLSIAIGIAFALTACAGDKKADDAPAVPPAPAATSPEQTIAAVGKVMAPYEQCRALLAADTGEGVAACAANISAAATSGAAATSDEAKPHMAAVAAAADKLAAMPADDVEALRLGFGAVSEPLVAVLMASPAAAKNYHLFECPMAAGYQKWVQPDAVLANPYMGTKMLACGSEVHDLH